MLKHSLSFLAGALLVSGAVFAAGGRWAWLLGLGALLMAIAVTIAVSNIGLQRTGRFLIHLAGAAAADRRPTRTAAAVDPSHADVIAALVNQGVPRRSASKAVARAAAVASNADFEPLFRASLAALKEAA